MFFVKEMSVAVRRGCFQGNVCRILSDNANEVYNLHSEILQRKWLIKLAYDQAAKYNEEEE